MYTPTHTSTCTHANTPTPARTQVHGPRHRALSRVRIYSASLAPCHRPSVPPIYPSTQFLDFSVCVTIPSKPQTEGVGGWGGGVEAEGRTEVQGAEKGAGTGRAPGGGGRCSQHSSAPGGRGSRQMRLPQAGAAERLSAESPGRPEEAGTAPERSRRTAPPGSGAQRWVSKLGRGGLRHLVPGSPSWCWGLWRGDRVAREGLVIWEALGCSEDFKGFYGPCLVERVRRGGLPFLERAVTMWL